MGLDTGQKDLTSLEAVSNMFSPKNAGFLDDNGHLENLDFVLFTRHEE